MDEDTLAQNSYPEVTAYKIPDIVVQEVEQYLAAINAPSLTQEEGAAMQRDFVTRCERNPALHLAYLEHRNSGVNPVDEKVRALCWKLRYDLAHASDRPRG